MKMLNLHSSQLLPVYLSHQPPPTPSTISKEMQYRSYPSIKTRKKRRNSVLLHSSCPPCDSGSVYVPIFIAHQQPHFTEPFSPTLFLSLILSSSSIRLDAFLWIFVFVSDYSFSCLLVCLSVCACFCCWFFFESLSAYAYKPYMSLSFSLSLPICPSISLFSLF